MTTLLSILHVLSSFGMGGQERVALDLATAQMRAGHRVHVVSLAPLPHGVLAEAFTKQGATVHSVVKGKGLDPRVVAGLVTILRREQIDVVHTHNPQPLVFGATAGRLLRKAVIHTKHGVNPETGRRLWLRRASGHLAHAYVAVSDATAKVARENRECSPSRLHIIPNGIDLAAYGSNPETKRAVREELGIPDGTFVFGTVGRVSVEKDHVSLVKAAGPQLDERTRLVIVGDGAEMGRVREAAREYAPWVHLTGMRGDVARLMASFDAFVLSSKSEGLPIALLEAMATGLAIVSTNVGGVGGVVDQGAAAILVPPNDVPALSAALAQVRDPERASQLAQKASERVRSYGIDAASQAYLELYRSAMR